MRRTVCLALVLGLVAGADALKDDYKKMEGTYQLLSGVKNGKKLSKRQLKAGSLVIKGKQHTVHVGGETIVGTHKLGQNAKPKTIDAMDTEGPYKGQTTLGIYELTGDQFKVSFADPGEPRPKDFKSGKFTHTWKRTKKSGVE